MTRCLKLLEFEEPIAVLLKEIEALVDAAAHDRARRRDRQRCERRLESMRGELYRVADAVAARAGGAPSRTGPSLEDFIERLFTDFIEIHGDRRFADDHAIMTGFADYKGEPVLLVGHVEGRRHQGEDLPQLRLRAAGGLPQGAARDAAGREVPPADHRVRRHAGGVSRASSRRSAASPRRSPSTCAR